MNTFIFFFSCLVTLFSVFDPFGAAVTLLALTLGDTEERRNEQARKAVFISAAILLTFTLFGGLIFALFGISIQALLVAGGIILCLIAIKMLEGAALDYKSTKPELAEAETKEDIAIIPLAIPVIAGPAAITTVMVFANRAEGVLDWIALFLAIGATLFLTHIILQRSRKISDWLGETGVRVLTRIMGLILLAMGAEFVLSGVKGYFG
ncbi:hypothetical protein MNBD_NITROSPINAE04-2612 [hydrothermal vent metagenome]|uniref:Uncharacterized protein n=1 Tax=hydrothermal vent metagenome TaxID=652676 RepID=A0A3B1CC59_9ZZZZ